MKKLITTIAVTGALVFSLASCNNKDKQDGGEAIAFNGYPIETDIVLEYWGPDLADKPFAQQLEKETGVTVRYLTPPAGQHAEQFNIILASGNYPDIMENAWINYPGGPEKAIADEVIISLNDVLESFSPNLSKYLDENPDIARMTRTDDGNYYVYPFIRGDDELCVSIGPVVRKDWLDSLNMDVPETVDDWYNMLKAFKTQKNAVAPLSFQISNDDTWGAFTGAFGVRRDFYLQDGNVKFGPMEPGYKEYLQTMAKWFSEGLLDKNFATVDGALISNAMLNDATGATLAYGGSGIGVWMKAKENDPSYQLVATPYPVKNRGDVPMFGNKDFRYIAKANANAAITTNCKNVELAARYLDYGYSETGHMLFNFGIEGESYNMIDGYPTYTDVIMNNPDKSISQMMREYMRGSSSSPSIQDIRYLEQYYTLDIQKEALGIWQTQADKTNLPPITPTYEESAELAQILNNVNTYVDENSTKFIMGINSLDDYDKFLNDIKGMDIDKVISIYNDAYKRYLNR